MPDNRTTEVRFWAKVRRTDHCWIWEGAKSKLGYGSFDHKKAYRVSWEFCRGEIPKGLCVLHRCDNPPCVNPDHLFLGTHADNARDRHSKGRTVLPSRHVPRQSHCQRGHVLSHENVYIKPNGRRNCKTCRRLAVRRYYYASR